MALAVDTAGKVKANPNTGNVMSSILGKIGAGVNAAEVAQQVKDNKAANALKKGAKEQDRDEVISQSVQEIAQPITSFIQPTSSQYAVTSTPPKGLGSYSGATSLPTFSTNNDAPQEEEVQKREDNDLSDWEFRRANDEGRDVRTTNYFGEQFETDADDNGLDDFINAIDPYAKYVGNTEANDSYIRDAMANGLSEEDAKDIMDRADVPWWQMLGNKYLHGSRYLQDDVWDGGNKQSTGDVSAIDDGTTYDYDHMTSDNMTGTQYMHYVEMGMGGRPIEQIDPTRTYSKRREQINYGFIPFTPDSMSALNMAADDAMDIPARAGAWIGGLREMIGNKINPYEILVQGDDGTTKRVNGPDFDKIGGAYVHQMEREDAMADPMSLEFPVPDVDGKMTYHYGYLTGVGDYGDGTYALDFSDGTSVDVDRRFFQSIENGDGTVSMRDFTPVTKETARGQFPEIDYDTVYYEEHPNLVMPDGTELTYDEARSIYYDREVGNNPEDPYDDNISYDLTTILPTLDNRPSRLNSEFFGDDGVNASTLLNNAVDWTLGSVPISLTMLANPATGEVINLSELPWIYSASNATSSIGGMDPSTYDLQTDSYGLAFGDYDDDGRLRYGVTTPNGEIDESKANDAKFWNALGNFAVPLTEEIVGPVGKEIIPVRKMLGWQLPDNPLASEVVKDFLAGMVEEGVEEDLGNIFDELTSYGPSGAFARQAVDKEGRPMYDLTGHEVRDTSTPFSERLQNFANPQDLANSFAGGALVDAAMQLNPIMPGNLWYNVASANRAKRIRQDLGIDRFVEPEEREHQELPESYLSQFSDEV